MDSCDLHSEARPDLDDPSKLPKTLESVLYSESLQCLDELNKDELVKLYQLAIERRNSLKNTNKSVQHKLASSSFKGKIGPNTSVLPQNSSVVSHETVQQYHDLLKEYYALEKNFLASIKSNETVMKKLNEKMQGKSEELNQLQNFKSESQNKILGFLQQDKGHKAMLNEIDQNLDNEIKLRQELREVELQNIKLNSKYESMVEELKKSDKKMTGCHLIDYEQLTAENKCLHAKIDERSKEVEKLDNKIREEITGCLHLTAKSDELNNEISILDAQCLEFDQELQEVRQKINTSLTKKDALLKELKNYQSSCVSLVHSNSSVLEDYQKIADENSSIESKIKAVKQ